MVICCMEFIRRTNQIEATIEPGYSDATNILQKHKMIRRMDVLLVLIHSNLLQMREFRLKIG